MNFKKIIQFFIVSSLYIAYLIISWLFCYRLLESYDMTIGDLSLFNTFDPMMYIRDVLVYLVLLGILHPALKSFQLIRSKRSMYICRYSMYIILVSFFMALVPNVIDCCLMLMKYFNLPTLLEASYMKALFFTIIFQWICYIVVGYMFLFFILCMMNKWKAAIITILICTGFYAIHTLFQIDILFKDYYPFEDLYDYRGFMNELSLKEWLLQLGKYICISILGYVVNISFIRNRDMLYDVE